MPAFEAQPNFPTEDLSPGNAQLLELVLANADQLTLGHETAENAAWLYRVGHKAMARAIERVELDTSPGHAFDHGIVTYEAISILVNHFPDNRNTSAIEHNALHIANTQPPASFVDYVLEARQRFTSELPLASAVVHEASTRYFGPVAHYAIDGAALARQFELDTAS